MKRNDIPILVLLGVLAACAPDDGGPTEEQLRERELSAREACIAERLLQQSREELATLESLGVVAGPVAFQRAYVQHAELRLSAMAHHDSAVNHSTTPADSGRHEEAAAAIQISAPDLESVEANVIRSYEAKASAIFNDPGHPCNWQSELETEE